MKLLNQKASTADLPSLYDILENNREYDISYLSELLFEDKKPFSRAATYLALKKDHLYFKEKNRNFIRQSKNEIDEKLRQEQLKQKNNVEKEQKRDMAIQWLKQEFPDYSNPAPDYLMSFIETIKQFAIHGENYKNINNALKRLKDISENVPALQLTPGYLSAFRLCAKLHIFAEDENLAIHRYNILTSFKEEEIKSANEASQKAINDKREDLRNLKTYSIDDETTKDIDDAFSVVFEEDVYKVFVHIADVASIIETDSLLDKHASNLGMSVYLPSGKISMFPSILSEDKISLIQNQDRPALTFITWFDNRFNIIKKMIKKSIINIDKNISYFDADNLLKNKEIEELNNIKIITDHLREKRLKNNGIEFLTPDIKITVENGEILFKKLNPYSKSSSIVKELMVLTGHQAATYCLVNEIPCVYVTQDEPLEPILFENRVLDNIVQIQNTIKKLNKSSLMTSPFKHYALGLECYTQCTSPIRRYHDLIIQKQIEAHLDGKPLPYTKEEIQRVSASSEAYRSNVLSAEREEKNYWILKHIQKHKDSILKGIILSSSRAEYRIYIEEFCFQAKMFSNYILNAGDRINTKVKKVNPRSGELILSFAGKY